MGQIPRSIERISSSSCDLVFTSASLSRLSDDGSLWKLARSPEVGVIYERRSQMGATPPKNGG